MNVFWYPILCEENNRVSLPTMSTEEKGAVLTGRRNYHQWLLSVRGKLIEKDCFDDVVVSKIAGNTTDDGETKLTAKQLKAEANAMSILANSLH